MPHAHGLRQTLVRKPSNVSTAMTVKGRLNRLLQSLSLRTAKISAYTQMSSGTLVVNTAGVELAYLDSGAPADASSYTTIFAVHGMIFTNRAYRSHPCVSFRRSIPSSHLPESLECSSFQRCTVCCHPATSLPRLHAFYCGGTQRGVDWRQQ